MTRNAGRGTASNYVCWHWGQSDRLVSVTLGSACRVQSIPIVVLQNRLEIRRFGVGHLSRDQRTNNSSVRVIGIWGRQLLDSNDKSRGNIWRVEMLRIPGWLATQKVNICTWTNWWCSGYRKRDKRLRVWQSARVRWQVLWLKLKLRLFKYSISISASDRNLHLAFGHGEVLNLNIKDLNCFLVYQVFAMRAISPCQRMPWVGAHLYASPPAVAAAGLATPWLKELATRHHSRSQNLSKDWH